MSTNIPISNIPPLGPPTGMMPGAGSSKFRPVDPFKLLRGNWIWLVLALFVGAGIGAGGWYLMDKYMAEYTSESQFDVQASNMDVLDGRTRLLRMNELEPLILREVAAIRATPLLEETLADPEVKKTTWYQQFNGNVDAALNDLASKVISANHIRGTPLLQASATTSNKDDAKVILMALQREYMKLKLAQVDADDRLATNAVTKRLNNAKDEINRIQGLIDAQLQNEPLESLEERTTEASLRVTRLVYEISNLEKSVISINQTLSELKERNNENPKDIKISESEKLQIESSTEIIRIDSQIFNVKVRRLSLAKQLGDSHPVVTRLGIEISALETKRNEEFHDQAVILFESKLKQAQTAAQILAAEKVAADKALEEWKKERRTFITRRVKYESLLRQQRNAEKEREDATKALEDLKEIDSANARVVVQVAVPPQKAKQSFPPAPFLMIPGVGIGLCALLTGLIFLREFLDQRVRSAADVKMIPDASLLGVIPDAGEDNSGSGTAERAVEEQPVGLLAESFRQVRTAMLSKIDRRGYKTLMMVSAKPRAGVTTITQNLAASCALSGRRVLIIEANFRRPAMAKLMGIDAEPGLADVLCGDQDMDHTSELVQETQTPGLSVLPAGNNAKAAVELFENPRFRELLARLEAEYDLLLIDAAPALLTSDAQLLSRHVDAMVLVSRADTDTRGMLERLYREMDGQRADILGIVLNGVQAAVGGYLKRNFREFHDYSGPERRKSPRTTKSSRVKEAAAITSSNGTSHIATAEPEPEPVLEPEASIQESYPEPSPDPMPMQDDQPIEQDDPEQDQGDDDGDDAFGTLNLDDDDPKPR